MRIFVMKLMPFGGFFLKRRPRLVAADIRYEYEIRISLPERCDYAKQKLWALYTQSLSPVWMMVVTKFGIRMQYKTSSCTRGRDSLSRFSICLFSEKSCIGFKKKVCDCCGIVICNTIQYVSIKNAAGLGGVQPFEMHSVKCELAVLPYCSKACAHIYCTE